jgi:predicted Zn finger-like uncharacterized protein
MDVRCEKCMTVYEFDDSQVSEAGVTVKCTQCGNLFKVKRRAITSEIPLKPMAARSPAYIPPAPTAATLPGPSPTRPSAAAPPGEDQNWMLRRAASGKIFRFREVSTLQQLILERKVTRDDEISVAGADDWKRLADMPELKPFFDRVEGGGSPDAARPMPPKPPPPKAAAPPRPAAPQPAPRPAARPSPPRPAPARAFAQPSDDPALTTTAPMKQLGAFDGPSSMGTPLSVDDPAFASTAPKPRVTPPASMASLGGGADLDEELPRVQRSRLPLYIAIGAAGLALGVGIVVLARRTSHTVDGKTVEALRQARDNFLLDVDDSFRQALALLAPLHAADESNPLVLAQLSEVHSTWAWYLREDARTLDTGGPATEVAAKTLRKDAQAHLDEAKRFAAEALAQTPDAVESNRAMGDFLRVDGAPAAEAERYLRRALDKNPNDAESVYVGGALAFREGRFDDARARLEQANQLSLAASQRNLLRDCFLLAKLAIATGRTDDARRWLGTVMGANPQHDRARALLATLAGAPDGGQAAAVAVTAPAAAIAPPPPAAPAAVPPAAAAPVAAAPGAAAPAAAAKPTKPAAVDDLAAGPADYHKLIAQADKLSENGRTDQARKLYERALTVQPRGVEAVTGLGYCDLDTERFMSALDRFKQALEIVPEHGEALIGIAEAYKIRGDKVHAIEYYRRYLKAAPGGAKAAMAQKNIHDLEPRTPPSETTVVPVGERPNELPRSPSPEEPPP